MNRSGRLERTRIHRDDGGNERGEAMPQWSRRDVLRASAAAAAVVPVAQLRSGHSSAATSAGALGADTIDEHNAVLAAHEADAVAAGGPVIVCVKDVAGGDVSILHGTCETVVRDPRLVAKIVRARTGASKD
jgi:hypothetical protein